MSHDPHQVAAMIKSQGRTLGFDLVGIATASPSDFRDYLQQWLGTAQHGEMSWLAKRFEERTDPATYLPGAKSVICVAINYHVPLQATESAGMQGRIARYALGDDYHALIKQRLFKLADWLRTQVGCETRVAVDTAPVMEKDLSARAGVGWVGKNTCLINENIGSWLLLGEILTTLELPPDQPGVDRCGTCTRCLDACPTGAITAPYQLDARKCISYLTIEHRCEINPALASQIGDWLYGCDICQDVCPWNGRAPAATDPALQPRFPTGKLDVQEVLRWSPDEYRQNLRGSAMKRVKLPILQRNARIVLDNSGGT